MKLGNATVLSTGANRGLGLAFARHALERGARRVLAGARDPHGVTLPGVEPTRLDGTRPENVTTAAQGHGYVTLLINNAGIAEFGTFLGEDSEAWARRMMEVNCFAALRLGRAFVPATTPCAAPSTPWRPAPRKCWPTTSRARSSRDSRPSPASTCSRSEPRAPAQPLLPGGSP